MNEELLHVSACLKVAADALTMLSKDAKPTEALPMLKSSLLCLPLVHHILFVIYHMPLLEKILFWRAYIQKEERHATESQNAPRRYATLQER